MPGRRVYGAVGATEPTALGAVGGEGGGSESGGGTIIEDGGTLSGTYEGNVVCLGTSTMTGNVEIIGDLLAIGDITNENGYDFVVRGNADVRDLEFDRTDPSLPQGLLRVQGNLNCDSIYFSQGGGLVSTIRVDGDLISEDEEEGIYANGNDDTGGATIVVQGNLIFYEIEVNGGGSVAGAAGGGGNVTVYGNMIVDYRLRCQGGSSTTGFSSGDGGSVTIHGNCVVGNRIDLDGGAGTESPAGNAGYLRIYGDARIQDVDMRGGDCNSTNHLHRAGTGGEIEIDGGLTCEEAISVRGGDRYGALAAPGEQAAARAGNVTVQGNLVLDEFNGRGGDILTTVHAGTNAGRGSDLTVNGSFVCYGLYDARGGTCLVGAADGGDAGYIDVEGDVTLAAATLTGGGTEGGLGGVGGSVSVRGSLTLIDTLNTGGGACANGSRGGDAGSIVVGGALTSGGNISAIGGACSSPATNAVAGVGGALTCGSLTMAGSAGVNLSCGARTGATLAAPVVPTAVNCQTLTVYGDATVFFITGNGGSCSTDFPGQTGGDGLTVDIRGSLAADEIYLVGGDAVGRDAGGGGTLTVGGTTRCASIFIGGGAAANSVGVGGDAGTNGTGGDAQFKCGGSIEEFSNIDGAGPGAAPTGQSVLRFGGSTVFGTVTSTNRADSFIKADPQAILKIESMPQKSTLNNADNSATGSIAADLATCIFVSGGGGWNKYTGTPVV